VQPAINLSVDAAIQMRVLIQKSASSLPISTSEGGGVFDVQSNKLLYEIPPKANYEMQTDGKQIYLGSTKLPPLVWIDPATTGVTFIGDRGYRGRLLVASSGQGLWVVNYVNLQQYLYSVVGSEVSPSWPMEALKAQAVAARSYALTYHLKPVKRDLYDLGDDEYFQVYKGIESEAQTTRQAVNSTSGEFVSYRGGVVESLYAATDDIVMDAFQGHGMSQIGALGLAEQGHTYRHILGTYYAGTGIGRIEMDIE
jgi:peptidoglycan hydrolase-like amidase